MKIDRSKALFMISLCLACFAYGIVTARFEIFPWSFVRNGSLGLRALYETVTVKQDDEDDEEVDHELSGPKARQLVGDFEDDLILVGGSQGYLKEYSPKEGCLAWIMDRKGDVKHVWHYDSHLWDDVEKVQTVPLKSRIQACAYHLYEDGGLLVNYHGKNTYPFAVGLARFDKDSKLLWKHEGFNHHQFSVADDGRIYTCALKVVDAPFTIGDSHCIITSEDGKIYHDELMVLDADGKVLEEIPLLDALIQSGFQGIFRRAATAGKAYQNGQIEFPTDGDPTHLNDMRVVDAEMAAAQPWLNVGDVLVSFCKLNTIGILDMSTKRFKWLAYGATIFQHAPRFMHDGILVFDNHGGSAASGGSRLVKFDFETRLPHTVFPASSTTLPGKFFTDTSGHLDLKGQDKALVALTHDHKIWEVDLKSGEVLWEYIFVNPSEKRRRDIYTAKYVRNANFPFNVAGK